MRSHRIALILLASSRDPPTDRIRPVDLGRSMPTRGLEQLVVGRLGRRGSASSSTRWPPSGRATRCRTRRRRREASARRASGSSTSSGAPARGCRSPSIPTRSPRQGRITRDVELRNVLAVLPGKSAATDLPDRPLRHGQHRRPGQIGANTRAERPAPTADPQLRADQDYDVDAPGANDNGSGTALTIELARVLADERSGVRRHARVRALGRRGAGPGRLARSRAATGRRHGGRRGEHQQRHRRQLPRRQRRRGQRVRARVLGRAGGLARRGRWRATSARAAALYVPSHRDSADGAPRSLRARQRPHVVQRSAAIRRSPSAKPTRTSQSSMRHWIPWTAWTSRIWRRTPA